MSDSRLRPGLAFVLSLVPGLGHVYSGRLLSAVIWIIGVSMAWRTGPGPGVIAHLLCATSAAFAAARARDEERAALRGRRESAEELGRMLGHGPVGGSGGAHPPADDRATAPASGLPAVDAPPAPRRPAEIPAAFPVSAAALRAAVLDVLRDMQALVVREEPGGRVSAGFRLGDGTPLAILVTVEEVRPPGAAGGASSRVRLATSRAADAPPAPAADEAILRGLLDGIAARAGGTPPAAAMAAADAPADRASVAAGAAAVAAAAAAAAAARSPAEPLTEDAFLDRLAEAWDAREQGWMPDSEWRERKAALIRALVLRGGTRTSDFLSACRPLVEAGILEPDDLRAIERSVGR